MFSNNFNKKKQNYLKTRGFSFIEVFISVGIFSLIAVACYQAFTKILVYSAELQAKSQATLIANEQFEILRNLPYSKVGIVGGIPSGVMSYKQTETRSGKQFEITMTIRNYDDPFDGTIGGIPNDLSPADSKVVEVSVVCITCEAKKPIIFTSRISPKGLETASTNGALFVKVFDGSGQDIVGAEVKIESATGSPVLIEDVTNNSGMVQVVDIPPGVEKYEITVTKDGYSTDKTYAVTVENPHPSKTNATVLTQQVTQVSFAIDRLSEIVTSSKNLSCGAVSGVDWSFRGSKKIGTNPDIFKTNTSYITNGSGNNTLSQVEWDTYYISVTDPAYNLAGSDPLLPLDILPGLDENLKLYVAPKSDYNLLVIVKDSATGLPLSGAEVKLEDGSFEETLITNEGFVKQTDWSGGDGQDDFLDETKFSSSDGGIEVNNPAGEAKLKISGANYLSNGSLTSSIFDIGTGTASFIRWQPFDQPAGTGIGNVKFQIASSNTNTSTTTWDFIGPGGGSADYYTTSNQSISLEHGGKRYLRYKMFLSTDDNSLTPNISQVAITYSSECTPPGQVLFSNLSSQTYTMTVSRSGYQTQIVPITVSSGGQQEVVSLSP